MGLGWIVFGEEKLGGSWSTEDKRRVVFMDLKGGKNWGKMEAP